MSQHPLYTRTIEHGACWLFAGARDRHGYGQVKYQGKLWKAHRLSYTLTHGPIPDGANVLHRCDTPACINPDHLFVGTQHDNIADMDAKGRRVSPTGAEHHATHLTDDDIRTIRRLCHAPRLRLARQFGISGQAVSDIRARRTWDHVED